MSVAELDMEAAAVLGTTWLLVTGTLSGSFMRWVLGDQAYGAVADALLGITGAFAVDWVIGVTSSGNESAWTSRLFFTIWGAAALPWFAHFVARRRPSPVKQKLDRGSLLR